MKSKKSLELRVERDLQSNKLKALQDFLGQWHDELDRAHKRLFDDLGRLASGTAQGQLAFWDGVKEQWVPAEVSEMFWNDTTKVMRIGTATNHVLIDSSGNITQVGIGRTIESEKYKITGIGGFAVALTNNTGLASVEGQLVETDDTDENSYKVADANSMHVAGFVYNAGVADGSEVWIVTGGIAKILIDAGGCVHHDRLIASATAGSADVSNTPSAADHFKEIGHALETVVGAGLAKVMIHLL